VVNCTVREQRGDGWRGKEEKSEMGEDDAADFRSHGGSEIGVKVGSRLGRGGAVEAGGFGLW
jgi:hypothetical protein